MKNRITCLTIFIYFALLSSQSVAASFGETLEFDMNNSSNIYLKHISGNIDIVSGAAGKVLIDYQTEDERISVKSEQRGNNIYIDVVEPRGGIVGFLSGTNSKRNVNFRISLPAGSRINVQSSEGRITATGISGDINLFSISGSVALDDVRGDIELRTVSGDLRIQRVRDADFSGTTTSGNIYFSNSDFFGDSYEFSTISGNTELSYSSDASFSVYGQSISGSITNDSGGDIEVSRSRGGRGTSTINGSYNGGEVRVDVFSLSGNIRLGLD